MQIVKKESGNAVERKTKQTDTFTLDFHTNKLHFYMYKMLNLKV